VFKFKAVTGKDTATMAVREFEGIQNGVNNDKNKPI
jgi:hypothetical protein